MMGISPRRGQISGFHVPELTIGAVAVPNRVILAPMSGITDAPFRRVAERLGAGLVVSEMTACAGLAQGQREANVRSRGEGVAINVVQLAGCERHWMAEGARIVEGQGAQIIDINMGCPSKQVTNGAAGSALMRDLDHALTLIDASLERVLLVTYPSMVVLVHSIMHRKLPGSRTVLALLATFLGIIAAVSGLDAHIFRANMHGAMLVLVCASTTTVYFLASDRWTPQVGSAAFTVWAMTAATLGLSVQALLVPSARPPLPGRTDLPLLLGLVGLATVFAMLMTAEGVRRLGAQRASVISTVGPPATILLAVPLLGERLNLAQWLGVALIIAGILFMELARTGALSTRGQVPTSAR